MPAPKFRTSEAVKAISRAVFESGQASEIERRTLEIEALGGLSATLPGFHLFSHDAHAKAVSWTLPKGYGDLDHVVGVYEEYVDRPLGTIRHPEGRAMSVMGRNVARAAFPKSRSSTEWWCPLAKLVAMAFRDSEAELKYRDGWVALDLGGYRMEATPTHTWSNFKGRMVPAEREASDANVQNLAVTPHVTTHPLGVALTEFDLPKSALWAANALFRSEPWFDALELDAFKQTPAALRRMQKPDTQPKTQWDPEDVLQAMETLSLQATSPTKDLTIRKLYDLAVPMVMPARVFVEVVGNPWRAGSQPLRSRAAARLRDYLAHL